MSEFHQTKMGHTFFEVQLPKLIGAINRLADAVEKLDADLNAKNAPKTENEAKFK